MNPFTRSGLGAALGKALSPNVERKDQILAERAQRIMKSEVWEKDFYPLLVKLHDSWLERVKEGKANIDALKALDDVVTAIDGSIQLGAGALKRISERRLKAAEISAKIKDNRLSSL